MWKMKTGAWAREKVQASTAQPHLKAPRNPSLTPPLLEDVEEETVTMQTWSHEWARGSRERGGGIARHSRLQEGWGQRRALLSTRGLDLAASESLAFQPKP